MKSARWIVPVLSLALVLGFTLWDVLRSDAGPGPVHPAHAAVAVLDGGSNCAGCHLDGAVAADACVRCHDVIGAQVAQGRGVHGSVQAGNAARCEWCHPEHHGDTVPLLPPHAFERVGIADLLRYDHAHVAFELQGEHLELTCDKCHPAAYDVAPPAGGRFLGLSQQCTSCHDDAHAGAFGQDCAQCHGQQRPFAEAPGFVHQRFALDGAHARVECGQCHAPGSERAIENEELAQLDVRGCAACHDDPHAANAAGDVAASLRFDDSGDCRRCHDATAWRSARPSPDEHAQLGFSLRGAHAAADCASCHGDAQRAPLWTAAAPALASCAACHQHEHSAALVTAATAEVAPADGCADCHRDVDADWSQGRITPAQHLVTGFALATPHADLACAKCHDGAGRELRFPGRAASDCVACHQDAHGEQFGSGATLRQCTECHDAHAFRPHRFGVAAHAQTYALTGAHDAVACSACHRQVVDGVRRFVDTPTACRQCHDDVHAGRFDAASLPQRVDGRAGCARCHDTQGFRTVVGDFDHGAWTGYPLGGAHAKVACADCHSQPSRARLGAVPGQSCADCHVDPHLGQFAPAGGGRVGGDCRRCHGEADWRELRFDHGRDSRFALDETHAALACSKCHLGYDSGRGEVIRYKPLGTTCGDCHQLGPDGGVR